MFNHVNNSRPLATHKSLEMHNCNRSIIQIVTIKDRKYIKSCLPLEGGQLVNKTHGKRIQLN